MSREDSSHKSLPSQERVVGYGEEAAEMLERGPVLGSSPTVTVDIHQELTDSEDEDEFVRKYGDINFQYIKKPRDAVWFVKPHALNYFKDGVLYRTKGERSSAKTELFLDLLYVGIIANLASDASENASGASLLKYVLLFIPAWTVWADIKDFNNFYFTEDLSQKVYIMWILCLLTLYANNHGTILEDSSHTALVIVPYMVCRYSLLLGYAVYSLFIPEHRVQMRLYSICVFVTTCLWIPVIFIGVRAKIGVAFAVLFLELFFFTACYHPFTKNLLKLRTSAALNIEHEVERFSSFVTIAIGEFLYKVVATSHKERGLNNQYARDVFLLIIAYCLFWIYNNGSGSKRATHPLRNSGNTAVLWNCAHLPMIAAIVLAADAGGELTYTNNERLLKHPKESALEKRARAAESTEKEPSQYALSFFFTGGICIALISMFVIGVLDRSKDPKGLHLLSKFWRVFWRVPIGIAILCLSFAEMTPTLMMGITTILLVVLLVYESVMMTPKSCLLHRPQ